MVWQCVASSNLCLRLDCKIFIFTVHTTAVAQLQGHFKKGRWKRALLWQIKKKNPLSTNSTGEPHQHFTNQHTSAAAVPSWCVFILPSSLWLDVLKVPNKGPKSQWAPWGLPNVWICCHPEDAKRNTCHTNKDTRLAWLVWCGDSICPWPHHCCQIHRKGTYMSLQAMWLLYWRIGGMHSSSSGSCEQLELQHNDSMSHYWWHP